MDNAGKMYPSIIPQPSTSFSPGQILRLERLAIVLALIAGYIDATGLIEWKTYLSFMSGNTTQLGTALLAGQSAIITTSVTVIGCFLLGIYTGTCLSFRKAFRSQALTPFIVSGILILYTVVSHHYHINAVPSIAIIGFSMGMMNTIVTSIGNQKVNTDFVTGTLNSLARNTALLTLTRDKTERKQYQANAIHLLYLWTGFLSGAFIAPCGRSVLGNWTLCFPALLLTICAFHTNDSEFKP